MDTQTEVTEEVVEDEAEIQEEVSVPDEPGAEATIAAKALEANPEVVPSGVAKGLREDRRELREAIKGKDEAMKAKDQLIIHLQTQLAAKQPENPAELSPAEKYIEENKDTFDPEIEALPAKIQIAQNKWLLGQQEAKSRAEKDTMKSEQTAKSLKQAQSRISDYEDIVEMGGKYLDAGDKLMIDSSEDPALELYNRCIDKTLKAGNKDSATLRNHLKAKLKPQPTPKSKEPEESQAESEEPMSPQLAHARRLLGL